MMDTRRRNLLFGLALGLALAVPAVAQDTRDVGSVLRRELRGGKQYHAGWLTISCANGDSFLTKQPDVDAFRQFAKARALDLTGFGTE